MRAERMREEKRNMLRKSASKGKIEEVKILLIIKLRVTF